MVKWLTSFVLVLVMTGSAVAGFPLQAGERNSGMSACCKAALAQDNSPSTLSAKLCCAINCSESVPTNPSRTSKISPLIIAASHPANVYALKIFKYSVRLFYLTPGHVSDSSPPPYIRHLALLI